MNRYSASSRRELDSCHPLLIELCEAVLPHWDHTVVEGHRSNEAQAEMLRRGLSRLGPGESKHNRAPSHAVDIAPYYAGEGIPWSDFARFRAFGAFVLGVAAERGIRVRWGGDWDGDRLFTDQRFHDLPHFELVGIDE